MDTLLPMAWGKTQKLQAQHMSLAIPPLHFSPKCIRFLCHQLPLLKPPSLGSSSLSSIPQDTSQWLRTRQCLKHPCISSFLMEERGTRSHLLYCAFSLVLADPLCDPIDQILYESRKSPLSCISSIKPSSLSGAGRPSSLWLGRWKVRNCAWQSASCASILRAERGASSLPQCFVCNNCSV